MCLAWELHSATDALQIRSPVYSVTVGGMRSVVQSNGESVPGIAEAFESPFDGVPAHQVMSALPMRVIFHAMSNTFKGIHSGAAHQRFGVERIAGCI
jgi:hypothetical protein